MGLCGFSCKKSSSHLIDLYCVTDKQSVFLLLFLLAIFVHEVRETQTDAQHHTCRRRTHTLSEKFVIKYKH